MIHAERVRLRRDEKEDLPRFVEWLNDPEVTRYLGLLNLPMSMANEQQWFDHMLALPREQQPFAIEARLAATPEQVWQLIGNCGFMDFSQTARSAEVGNFIGDKTFWNKGYGTETMRLLLHIGFGTLNLNRIFLRVDEANKGGIRAYEKAGFVHEGRLRQATFQDGQYRDMLLMSALRSEWTPELQVEK